MLAPVVRADIAARPRLRIGDWWVDPAANALGRDGESLRIEPKAMQVLVALADCAGRVVTREELFSTVWPGVVVGDEALTQTIIKLRKALGDNPRSPAYIETISKRGYRLIAPVGQDATAAPGAGGALEDAPQERLSARARRRIPWVPTLAAVLLAAAIAALHFSQAVSRPGPQSDALHLGNGREPAPLTITVLPFESLGADEAQGYLARGISNDLMTDLSRLPGLRLIRASSGARRGQSAGAAQYLVLGSVQRESGILRINVHLVDTRTNQQLWSERFERPPGDLFALQDEIVRRLTETLPGKLADAARRHSAKRYTRSLEAYDYFLRAQALFLVRQAGVNEEARNLYRKALELDPKFARAYAGLAMTYAMDHRLRPPSDVPLALRRAFELAETARLIDPEIPEVYWALAFVHAQSRRHEEALQSLKKAIELNRSFADAYAFMGGILTYVGESARSIPLLRTALRLNPDGGYLYYLLLGRAYLFEGDVEQALLNLREAAARNPADLETHLFLAAALAAAGDRSAAEWEGDEIRAMESGFSTQSWLQAYPMTDPVRKAKLQELLAKAGL